MIGRYDRRPGASPVERPGKAVHMPPVRISRLFAILIAFAMLFAPLAMRSGAAMAMAPADHHAQMTDKGHCGEQSGKSKDGKSVEKNCCAAMCTGVATTAMASLEPHSFHGQVDRPAPSQFHHGFLAELPTPPPRLS
ncbi:hypothetical protein H8M03_03125 [Sphingomonas sabuli]|uniref:DUF2946 domain-containing protein n=1 Tax=Sphingomonas sabuli TaxID=2764186 RepID=A0A7G9L404_9SPHN|nr:hypothetical protein [Sphingomonas sabuli]QNM83353.1 hypothetical protein H8M03_03125 [Sphingomonas sabuli]